MKLSDYLSVHGGKTTLARAIGAQPQLVWQWATGVRPVPIARCMSIERVTHGAVTRRDLRPGDWADIWPELVIAGETPNHTAYAATQSVENVPRLKPAAAGC